MNHSWIKVSERRSTQTNIGTTSLQHSYNKYKERRGKKNGNPIRSLTLFTGSLFFLAEEGVDDLEKQAVSIDVEAVRRWTDLDIKNRGRSVRSRCRCWDPACQRFDQIPGHARAQLL